MSDNVEIIRKFIAEWSSLDVGKLVDYFTEDGTYHNMPLGPVSGRDNLKAFITNFLANWTSTQWDILNIIGHGEVVFAERLDRTKIGEIAVDLPCCGVFEMQNGKIAVWRDYFDMATFTNALSK